MASRLTDSACCSNGDVLSQHMMSSTYIQIYRLLQELLARLLRFSLLVPSHVRVIYAAKWKRPRSSVKSTLDEVYIKPGCYAYNTATYSSEEAHYVWEISPLPTSQAC